MGEKSMSKYWLPWFALLYQQTVFASWLTTPRTFRLVGMPAETSLAICSLIFGGIFERLPNLKVGFAHAGGSFPGTIGRIEHGWSARPDLCATECKRNPREFLGMLSGLTLAPDHQPHSRTPEFVGRFWVDSLTHDADCLKHVVNVFGRDKVVLGTDYPFPCITPCSFSLCQAAHPSGLFPPK